MKVTRKQKKLILNIVIGFGVLAALIFWYYLLFGPTPNTSVPVKNITISQKPESFDFPYQSNLDGTGVSTKEEIYPIVVAVMIDNHPDARPPAGLSKARVVYEVPVEDPYTRFMTFFALNDNVEKVGPVRSARPYFVHWAEEYGLPMYLHSGGSPDGLALLASSTLVYDTNEFWNGSYFWRGTDHAAPHNVYTKSSLWQSWYQNKVSEETGLHGVTQSWNFVTSQNFVISLGPVSTTLEIPYASGYTVSWEYNTTSSRYVRSENNKPKTDADGSPVIAATVIVQFVDIKTTDRYGRKAITQTGSGEAIVYTAGRVIKGIWQKIGSNRTRWYDALGAEIPIMFGPVWVEVVAK